MSVWKAEGRGPRLRWEDNIKINFIEIGYWIGLIYWWRALVQMVMSFRVP
jgi:hypothetical protein